MSGQNLLITRKTSRFFFAWDEKRFNHEVVYAWTDKKIPMPSYTDYERLTVELSVMALCD